jgi:hypothetical protein
MKRIAFVVLLSCISLSAAAQEKPVVISGYLFGDYYAVVSHHDASLEGKNAFWIRRGYLTFDRTISDALSARLRFEINQPGDFRTTANTEPYVKDAWLKWKRSPKLDVIVGISPAPAFETIEKAWGYRSVEKTPLDLQKMAASRDFGVAVIGTIGTRYRWHVMAGNGSGTGSETNDEKQIAGAFSIAPTKATLIEVYADRDARPGNDDRTTLQAFASLQRPHMRAGIQFAHQVREAGDIDVASVFGVIDVRPNVTALARIDRMFDANPDGAKIAYLPFSSKSRSTLFIAGIDWKAHKNVSVIPNVEIVRYDDGAASDILPRVTLFFSF